MHLSKSEFAASVNRSPAAVSHWIRDGQLTAPALTTNDAGEEVVDVDLAKAQLGARLDPTQQLAQVKPIGLGGATAAVDDDEHDSDDALTKRYLRAKAEQKELEVQDALRRHALEAGKYVETEAAKREFGRQVAGIIAAIDGWIGQAGRDLATELNVEERAAAVALRKSFRAFREKQAAENAAPLPQAAE